MKVIWTDADTGQLRRLAAKGLNREEIAARMGVSRRLVGARALRHGIEVKRLIAAKFAWTPERDAELARRYESEAAVDIARDFGCSVSAIYNRAFRTGLSKGTEFARECTRKRWAQGRHDGSRRHLFQRGHVPVNNGVPQAEWMDPEAARPTQFKPGDIPYNWVPVGSMRVTADGTLERKVSDVREAGMSRRNWVPVSRLVWEAAHGPVPSGHVVRFRDGMATTDPALITLDRLELLSRRENMLRNSRHTRYPPEVNQLIQLKGALNRKIRNREKKQ